LTADAHGPTRTDPEDVATRQALAEFN